MKTLFRVKVLLHFFILFVQNSRSLPDGNENALNWIQASLAKGNPALNLFLSAITRPIETQDGDLKLSAINAEPVKYYGQCCNPNQGSTPWCRRRRICPRCVHPVHPGDLNLTTPHPKSGMDEGTNHMEPSKYCLTDLGRDLNPEANTCCVNSLFDATLYSDCDCFELNMLRPLISKVQYESQEQSAVWYQANLMIKNQPADLPAVFSVLLNFGLNGYWQFLISLQNVLNNEDCKDQYIWDPFAKICRPVYCPAGSDQSTSCFAYNGTLDENTQGNIQYTVDKGKVFVTLYAHVESVDADLLADIEDNFIDSFCQFVGISSDRISNLSVTLMTGDENQASDGSLNVTSGLLSIRFCLEESLESSGEPSSDMLVAYLGSIIFQDQLVSIVGGVAVQVVGIHEDPVTNPSSNSDADTWCRGGFTATYGTDDFMIVIGNASASRYHHNTQYWAYIRSKEEWYEPGRFAANLLLRVQVTPSVSQLSGYVVVCENRSRTITSDCQRLHLNESDFIFFGNGSVQYLGSLPFIRSVLNPGTYQSYADGRVAVCIDLDSHNFPLALTIASYLSLILTSISECAMTVTIVTYLLFAELRNLPGMTILNLTLSKFLFQLTFLLGMRQSVYQEPQLCLAVAILVHYEGLAAFSWSNIMAWDLFLTFGRRMSGTPRHFAKIFPRYALYAYGLPLFIVTISVSISLCECTGTFTVGYGKLMCWMSEPLASFLFFGLPIALALGVNAVLFLITVSSIRRVSGSIKSWERHSHKKKGANELWMYARMCTVMGFVWIFGLISSSMDIMSIPGLIVTYIYAILNALDGLFIFVAFTCNRRVAILYRRLFRLPMTSARPSSTEVPTTTFTASKQMKSISADTPVTSPTTEEAVGSKGAQLDDRKDSIELRQN